ncbi:MAG TPA: hypothetical protein VKB86_00240 [Pyrinomonadaceae bacterium]|nr:hypothetical protein [Pyrinomonadaceae bacterium]
MNGDTGNPEYLARILDASSEVMRLMLAIDEETNKEGARIDALNADPPTNPSEAVKSAEVAASGFDLYREGLEKIALELDGKVEALTDAYSKYVKTIDLETSEGRGELRATQEKLSDLLATYRDTNRKVSTLRSNIRNLEQNKVSERLRDAARNLGKTVNRIFSFYEDLETFGLTVSFAVDEKANEGGEKAS